jgi:hypothetical protein
VSNHPTLDDYYDALAPTARRTVANERTRQQALADREGIPLDQVQYREREAIKATQMAAVRQREDLYADAMQAAAATVPPPPPNAHPTTVKVYAEVKRQAVERARQEAEAIANDPERLQQVTDARELARQHEWEDEYKRSNGVYPSIEELDKAGVLAGYFRRKWGM